MPKIEIEVKRIDSETTWKEDYIINDADPREWAETVISNFNATLREGEIPRQLVNVTVLDESEKPNKHNWEKQNLITIVRGVKSYDEYKCGNCGITGKRHGLSHIITRDHKYKAKKYEKCQN